MKKTFNKTYIRSNKGCYKLKQVNNLSFINNKIITIEDILNSEIPLKDKLYFLFCSCELDLKDKQLISIELAEIVLPIYENKYPDNLAPREVIQASKDYLNRDTTLENLKIKIAAAYTAIYTTAYAAVDIASANVEYSDKILTFVKGYGIGRINNL